MYTHRMCVVLCQIMVKSSVSAILTETAHCASQCFALSQGTKRESEARREKKERTFPYSRFAFPLGLL